MSGDEILELETTHTEMIILIGLSSAVTSTTFEHRKRDITRLTTKCQSLLLLRMRIIETSTPIGGSNAIFHNWNAPHASASRFMLFNYILFDKTK